MQPNEPKAATSTSNERKQRATDYTRTDKRPHSYRYKRGSTFVPRETAVTMSKEADGVLVIGPAPDGATPAESPYEAQAGELTLVSIKKRPNGKTAIGFRHPTLGDVVCYDARAARASLRAS